MAVSSQFIKVSVNDFAAAAQDISGYVLDFSTPRDADSVDVTAFRTGGKDVTQAKVRGALKSEFTITVLWCPFIEDLFVPLCGLNTGTLFDARFGKGAAPTTNDDKFAASMIVCKIHEDYSAASTGPATWKIDFKPTDGGATPPAWSKI